MPVNTNSWNRIRYTLWAPIYDRIAAFPTYRRRALELLRPAPAEDILILGAGTGADLPYIPSGVQLTAVDITPAMLERLRQRAAALGKPAEALVMDGQALDLPSGRFDAVILHLILAVIPDPVACIREAERVLKPGGRAVIFDKFVPDNEQPTMGRRLVNLLANFLFSDLTRKLGPMVGETQLIVQHKETFRIAGVPYEIVILKKPAAQG